MAFFPKVNDKIMIGWEAYTFTEHPYAPGMPYGQTGRKGTVYQLKNSNNKYRALKVFASAYRSFQINSQASDLSNYANLPGLAACKRLVISERKDPDLISSYPDLLYSVLMPWLTGHTWQEYVMNRTSLSKSQSWKLAHKLVEVLAIMEKQHIAHCDLSGSNLIIKNNSNGSNGNINYQIALIDLEDLYAEGLRKPEKIPAGSSGYAHESVKNGSWSDKADRFSGSILISNILAWSNSNIHGLAFGEQYFDPKEMQTSCRREKALNYVLKEEWSKNVADLFSQAWYSDSLDNCPPFCEWAQALNVEIPEIALDPKETFDSTNTHGITGGPVTGWKAITNGTSMGGTNSGSLKNRVSNSKEYIGDVLFTEWEELNNRSHYTKKRKEEKTSPIYIKSSFKDHDPERKYYSEEDYSPEYIMIMLFGLLVIVITIIVIIAANL